MASALGACGGSSPDQEGSADGPSGGPAGLERPTWERLGPGHGLDPLAVDIEVVEERIGAWAGGVAAADLDGDGWTDLYVVNPTGPDGLYFGRRDGGFDPDPPDGWLGDADTAPALGVVAADLTGDGRLDLVLHGIGVLRVFVHQGERRFAEATASTGVDDGVERAVFAVAPGDYDGDGDLDLFLGSYSMSVFEEGLGIGAPTEPGDGSRLLRNAGGGTYVDATDTLPADSLGGWTFQGRWIDLDRDGDLDLVIANDFGFTVLPDQVLRNDGPDGEGWRFTSIGGSSGLGVPAFGMGTAFGDPDGDGDDDSVVTTSPGLIFLEAVGPESWVDGTAARGLGQAAQEGWIGWATTFADLDLDGREDLLVAFSHLRGMNVAEPGEPFEEAPRGQPTAVYWGDGRGLDPDPDADTFASAVDRLALALADFNQDGVPDLAMGLDEDGPVVLRSSRGEGVGHWLGVRVDRPGHANRFGVGATVSVWLEGVEVRRGIDGGGGTTFSSSEPTAWFGLGAAASVERVEVVTPDGESLLAEPVAADQVLTLPE